MLRKKLRRHFLYYKKIGYVPESEKINNDTTIKIIDCSLGVNPFGYSSLIDKRLLTNNVDIGRYPPFPYEEFKKELILYWQEEQELLMNQIRVCSGTMLILNSINSLFIDEGDKVLGYSPQFPEYVNSVRARAGKYVGIPLRKENNYAFNADDIIEALKQDTYKLIYIDNPNNPTGQIIPIEEIEKIIRVAREEDVCVIVDEAYGDYMDKSNSALTLINKYENFYVIRSFSKGFSLPSMRVGYLIASEELTSYYDLIDDLVLNPVGLEAAKIALQDTTFLSETIKKTHMVKEVLVDGYTNLRVLQTSNNVPIFALQIPNEYIDLKVLLQQRGIQTSGGFENVKQNTVRVRIPNEEDSILLKEKLLQLDKELTYCGIQ